MKGVPQEQNLSARTMPTTSAHAFVWGHYTNLNLNYTLKTLNIVKQIRFVIYHNATNSIVSKLEVG